MSDDLAMKKIVHYLMVGNSTADSLRGFLGSEISGPQYQRVMTRMELDGMICRGTWGALAVWKLKRTEPQENPLP